MSETERQIGDGDDAQENNVPLEDDQDEGERRHIRHQYRQLMNDIQVHHAELADPATDTLNTKLREADELYKPVKKTREAALDSGVLAMIANIGRLKAQALNTEFVKFQAVEFAEKLITFVSGQRLQDGQRISEPGWERLGEAVQPFFKRAAPFHFMHGAFEPGELPPKLSNRNARKKRDKDDIVGQATVPKQLQDFSETDKNEATTAEVEKIHNILLQKYDEVGQKPICYFEFVVNPESFGQTVENMFYTSFLIRDGYAAIYLDADSLPVIEPVSVSEGEVTSDQQSNRQQVIISITPKEFRQICKTFEIQEPLIPTRPSSLTPQSANQNGKGKGKGKGKNRDMDV